MAHIVYSLVVCPSGEMKRNSVQDLPRLEATSLRFTVDCPSNLCDFAMRIPFKVFHTVVPYAG